MHIMVARPRPQLDEQESTCDPVCGTGVFLFVVRAGENPRFKKAGSTSSIAGSNSYARQRARRVDARMASVSLNAQGCAGAVKHRMCENGLPLRQINPFNIK